MNIRIKRAMIAAGIMTAMTLPLSGHASDGTITFSGAVTASSCVVSVNSAGATATVALPTVDTAALTGASGPTTTAAGTFFNMAVSGCATEADIGDPAAAPTQVAIYFEAGPNVDEATGGLINRASGGSNVEVKLYNASGSTVVGTQVMPGTPTNQPSDLLISGSTGVGATQTQWFYAGYSATGAAAGGATAGAVSTSVTYSLVYN